MKLHENARHDNGKLAMLRKKYYAQSPPKYKQGWKNASFSVIQSSIKSGGGAGRGFRKPNQACLVIKATQQS